MYIVIVIGTCNYITVEFTYLRKLEQNIKKGYFTQLVPFYLLTKVLFTLLK